ncbi:MAG: DUF523 domain-containing protein [Planctomycetaceae bacterium]|nr:DUF523 domain-containing protein [Planctomycetaceae bacterium]
MTSEFGQRKFFEDTGMKPPVLISGCLLGIPCRYHGRRAKKRDDLIERLQQKYVLVPVCPEQLGGMSTPRTSEYLPAGKTGADVLDRGLRLIAPKTGKDVTDFHVAGGGYTLEIAQIIGAKKAYMKGGSPSCNKEGIVGEILTRGGVHVVRVG